MKPSPLTEASRQIAPNANNWARLVVGGGLVDAERDGSQMVQHRRATMPGLTHYTMFATPVLADTVIPSTRWRPRPRTRRRKNR